MSNEIKITFLGTSSQIPSAKRNHTAMLLSYKGENILVDCGEGTQRQFRKAKLNLLKVTRILITHWHSDHVLGIPGLLHTMAFSGRKKALHIYGPRGTKKYMKELMELFGSWNKFQIKVEEIVPKSTGKMNFFETDDFCLEAAAMDHGTPTNAYSFVKKGQIRIDKKKLKASKLPHGPLLKKLKEGKDVTYSGKKFKAKNLTYTHEGKKVSFILDTALNKNMFCIAENSNVFVCEASFMHELNALAKDHKHLTTKQAAEVAKKAKVGKLVLTHISHRYDTKSKLKSFISEAKKVFKNTALAEDLDVIEF